MKKRFTDMCEAIMAKGLMNAYMKGGKLKAICPKCGVMVPKYPGRYGKCPLCFTRYLNDPQPVTNQDNGEIAVVPDDAIDATDDPTYGKDKNSAKKSISKKGKGYKDVLNGDATSFANDEEEEDE